jgi:hypothetical protein
MSQADCISTLVVEQTPAANVRLRGRNQDGSLGNNLKIVSIQTPNQA